MLTSLIFYIAFFVACFGYKQSSCKSSRQKFDFTRLLLAHSSHTQSESNTINFGGIKFSHPISTSLNQMNIIAPSPIQQVVLAPLTAGLSAIIHAETGSGKTFAYILPLLKRLLGSSSTPSESSSFTPVQGLIIVPSKELAVQVRPSLLKCIKLDLYLCLLNFILCFSIGCSGHYVPTEPKRRDRRSV